MDTNRQTSCDVLIEKEQHQAVRKDVAGRMKLLIFQDLEQQAGSTMRFLHSYKQMEMLFESRWDAWAPVGRGTGTENWWISVIVSSAGEAFLGL